MKYLIDSGNLEEIKHANEFYPLAGVTTNPSIIAKEKADFVKLVTSIRDIIGEDKMLHIQATAKKAEDIVKEAVMLKDLVKGDFYVKIPIGEEGLKATALLKKKGIGVTMTAIFTPQQALMAARAGADFVAPYVTRLDNISADGVDTVSQIVDLLYLNNLNCQVLAASFKNVQQVNEVALAGAHTATIGLDLLSVAVSHPMTDMAIQGFDKDWAEVYGDKSVKDLIG